MDLVVARELLGDLKAGIAATDDEHRAIGDGIRRPVLGAVQLYHVWVEPIRDRGHERNLEGPGGDHDLLGCVSTVIELDSIATIELA